MAGSLRRALEAGDPDDQIEQLTRAALGAESSGRIVARFRAWQAAEIRAKGASPGSPEVDQLREDAARLWAAYESTVDEADGG